VRAIRTSSWPRFVLGGAVLVLIGAVALSGAAQAVVIVVGGLVVLFALVHAINTDDFVWQEPPVPPGSGGA
jgi:hypothetical protein